MAFFGNLLRLSAVRLAQVQPRSFIKILVKIKTLSTCIVPRISGFGTEWLLASIILGNVATSGAS